MRVAVKDVYTWKVVYADGTCTCEFDAQRPDGRGWAEREEKEVSNITLMRVEDGVTMLSLDIPVGTEPVFFRRRSILAIPDEHILQHRTVHCIGWKPRGAWAEYYFVFDDGQILYTNDFQAV